MVPKLDDIENVQTRYVSNSINEMNGVIDFLRESTEVINKEYVIINEYYIDEKENKVVLGLSSKLNVIQLINPEIFNSITLLLDKDILIVEEEIEHELESTEARAGYKIYNLQYTCTLGMSAVDEFGNDGYVTAGHCGDTTDDFYIWNGSIYKPLGEVQLKIFGGKTDALFIERNPSSEYTVSSSIVDGKDITSAVTTTLPTGTVVYSYGQTTGHLVSGTITSNNYSYINTNYTSDPSDDISFTDLYMATFDSEHGDSGAPVFYEYQTGKYAYVGIQHAKKSYIFYERAILIKYHNIANDLDIYAIVS